MFCAAPILENRLYLFLNIDTVVIIPKKGRLVDGIEVLDEKVIYQSGSFMRVKRWLRGVHPTLGTIVWGLTGWETLVEKDVIKPTGTFYVHEEKQIGTPQPSPPDGDTVCRTPEGTPVQNPRSEAA